MAFSLLPGADGSDQDMAEINVTPLVDVMLVLLIIFMIAAPMLHQGVDVDLPDADADPLPLETEDPIVLSLNQDGLIYLREEPIHPSQLVERLEPVLARRSGEMVFLKADERLPYGEVMGVLDLLNRGGIGDIGLVTEDRQR